MLASLGRRAASLLFGGSCYLCRGAASGILCESCDADLPRLGPAHCPRCALASPGGALCGRCLTQPPAYDATSAALAYAFPADVLVQALKFRGELAIAPVLGDLLARCITQAADCIVPVPLSNERLRSRGYNQSLEIARRVEAVTGSSLAPGLCERRRDTATQMDLPIEERAKNVRGAFHCPAMVGSATVAVLDDVMTTGATLDEIAATLKRAGLDYHEYASVRVHPDWASCLRELRSDRIFALTTRATNSVYDTKFSEDDAFVFGSETAGLPRELLETFKPERRLRLPMRAGNRSLNLSNAVAVTVFEAWRQLGFAHSA